MKASECKVGGVRYRATNTTSRFLDAPHKNHTTSLYQIPFWDRIGTG